MTQILLLKTSSISLQITYNRLSTTVNKPF
jgi:hypothetical protein